MEKDSRNMFYGATAETFKRAEELRKKMTQAESVLWDVLKNGIKGFKFRRQHPIDIYIADFYCHKRLLVIELDGEIHYNKENREKDLARTIELEVFGINVIRFSNKEVLTELSNVIERIEKFLS
jgi:very-short-patch-repair endonuclease